MNLHRASLPIQLAFVGLTLAAAQTTPPWSKGVNDPALVAYLMAVDRSGKPFQMRAMAATTSVTPGRGAAGAQSLPAGKQQLPVQRIYKTLSILLDTLAGVR